MRCNKASALLVFILVAAVTHGQSPQRSTQEILGFEIEGINALMPADEARRVLLDAGFAEKGDGDLWGKTPAATFTKDDLQIGLGHRDGRIVGISATRIARGDDFDYSTELARIRAHFKLPDGEDNFCLEQDHGTRCGLSDGQKKGARFLASLTTRMIHVQVGAPR